MGSGGPPKSTAASFSFVHELTPSFVSTRPTPIMPRTAADPVDSVFVPHLGGNGRRLELRPGLSQIYVKDGQHRESLVRVAKAADQRVADLCRMVPGLCEDDLTAKFIALLTGKVTVPSDEPLPEPSNVAEPRELKELGPTVDVGSRVVHSTDVFMHSKDSVRDDYKSRHLGLTLYITCTSTTTSHYHSTRQDFKIRCIKENHVMSAMDFKIFACGGLKVSLWRCAGPYTIYQKTHGFLASFGSRTPNVCLSLRATQSNKVQQ